MAFEEVLELAKVQALKDVQILLQNQVGVAFVPAANVALEKLKAVIPGDIDDNIINMFAPQLVQLLKEALLEQIAKVQA